jgi:hypothetical protein
MTKVVDELVEDALRELADQEEQARLWLSTGGEEVSSLIECASRLWDDSGLATAMDHDVVYSISVDKHLRELRDVLHRIDATAPVDIILANPCLADARGRAHELLEEISRLSYKRAAP